MYILHNIRKYGKQLLKDVFDVFALCWVNYNQQKRHVDGRQTITFLAKTRWHPTMINNNKTNNTDWEQYGERQLITDRLMRSFFLLNFCKFHFAYYAIVKLLQHFKLKTPIFCLLSIDRS